MAHPIPVILLVFANDLSLGRDSRRHLDALPTERRQIDDALHAAVEAGSCEVALLPDATAEDIVRAFQSPRLRDRIAVLHFGGHADPAALLLETPDGGVAAVAGDSLAAFLASQPDLTLVFINGCNSLNLARRLLQHGVSAVIGTTDPELDDQWAAHFATVFYRALAGGRSLEQAFREAKTAPRGQSVEDYAERRKRGIGIPVDESVQPETPWHLETRPGEEKLREWRLQDSDPLRRLPLPKDLVLPTDPFHLVLLKGYERKHARAFLGRRDAIRQLYDALNQAESPIQLFYGQSGVGKSSVLAAGLLPRLEASHALAYLRRPPQTGLLSALIEAIGGGTTLAMAWRDREARDGKPLLVVLDQVEELLQNSPTGLAEWQSLLSVLESLFQAPEHWPQGKLLLGLRKEWLAEVDQDLRDHHLPFKQTKLLKRLNTDDIVEILRGATALYGLKLSPETLSERIAADLQADPESPVAPTLQILLSQLWQEATREDVHAPQFDEKQYERLHRQGLHLEDFLDRKLAEMRQQHPTWERSGLGLEILNEHTTDLGFAAERTEQELRQHFPRQAQELPKVLTYFKDRFLLSEAAKQGREASKATRLVHDTLAPLVRRKWRLMKQREELKKERRRTLIARSAAGVLLAVVGYGVWWWDANVREITEYYAHFERRWGFPVGIGALSRDDVRQRDESYLLVRYGRKNPVEEARIVNGSGYCPLGHTESMLIGDIGNKVLDSRRICRYHFTRDRAGKIVREYTYDANDRKAYELLYTSENTAKYNDGGYDKAQAVSGASYVAFEFTPEGYVRGRYYTDSLRHPLPDTDGCYGLAMELDSQGLPLQTICLNQERKPIQNKFGYTKKINRFDENGNIVESADFDERDRPVQNTNGYAKLTQHQDKESNIIEEIYLDERGQPKTNKFGYAKLNELYDKRGNMIEAAFFDEQGQPIMNKGGYAKVHEYYDERGNDIETVYFDDEGRPTQIKKGYAKVKNRYDDQGDAIEHAYFDEQDRPIKSKDDGYAKWIQNHDKSGNLVEQAYFDELGRPTRSKNIGCAKLSQRFNERGNLIGQACFDEKGQPTQSNDGHAKIVIRYDERGNVIEEADFNVQGQPTRRKYSGCAKLSMRYNERGNLIEQTCFDEQGRSIIGEYGYAKLIQHYDERGNVIEMTYFDQWGQPFKKKNGNAKLIQSFDERNNLTEKAYFDENSQPWRSKDGYTKIKMLYDQRGNVIEEAYFDEQDMPIQSKSDGYAKLVQRFDKRDNLVEQTFFDELGKPTRDKNGFDKVIHRYDKRDNLIEEEAFYGEQGKSFRIEWPNESIKPCKADEDGHLLQLGKTIMKIMPNGQAAKLGESGLKPGDIVETYNGIPVKDVEHLIEMTSQPGKGTRELVILRDNKRFSFQFTPGKIGIALTGKIPTPDPCPIQPNAAKP